MRFFIRNGHWVFLVIVSIGFLTGMIYFTLSMEDIIAAIFSILGMAAVIYLCIYVERHKKHQQNDEKK
jgi:hypothetical protein